MQTIEPPQAVMPPNINPTSMTLHTPEQSPVNETNKHTLRFTFIAIGLVLGALLLITATFYVFFIRPRITLIKSSKTLTSSLTPVKAHVKEVAASLKDMFDSITNQSKTPTNNKLLRLNIDTFISKMDSFSSKEGEVAGVSTSTNAMNSHVYDFARRMKSGYEILKKGNGFGSVDRKVLGSNTALESERVTKLRQLKEYAKSGAASATNADSDLMDLQKEMSSMIDSNLNTSLYPVLKSLGNTNLKAQSYLAQAQRTTSYYEKIAEIQIRLEPLLASYYTLITSAAQSPSPEIYIDRIKEIETTINEIDKEISSIKASSIPDGMASLHADNVKVGEILAQNVSEVRLSLEKEDYLAFLTSVVNVSQKLEPIATRAVSTELSFWQDNKYLREGDTILGNYDKNASLLQDIINKNKIPFLAES